MSVTEPWLSGVWVGRRAEMHSLMQVVHAVADGQGRVVLIEGEPGIGKSALAKIGLTEAEKLGCQVYMVVAEELTARLPLQVLADMLGLPPSVEMPSISVLARIERIQAHVDELCAKAPTVLVLDDLQWADEASLLVWSRLSAATDQTALLLVGICRSVPVRPELAQLRRSAVAHDALVFDLQPLSRSEATELARGILGAGVGPELSRRVAAAGGNPLFVQQTVDALLRAGVIVLSSGMAEVSDHTSLLTFPLQGVIADRLGCLTSPTREALRRVSLLGIEFSVNELAVLTGRSPWELLSVVDEAIDAGVLEASDRRLRFRHELIRDAVYESIPAPLRTVLHREAAEALAAVQLPDERIAGQVLMAGPDMDAWTVAWLVRHGDDLATHAPEVAYELLTRAMKYLSVDDPRQVALGLGLVVAAFRIGAHDDAERVARQLLLKLTDADQLETVLWILGNTLSRTGRLNDALHLISEALPGSVRLRSLRAHLLLEAGRFEESAGQANEALLMAKERSDQAAAGYSRQVLSTLAMLSRDTGRAVALVQEALEEIGEEKRLVDLRLLLLTQMVDWSDRADDSTVALRSAQALSRRIGGGMHTCRLAVIAAVLQYRTGRWGDALAELEGARIPADMIDLNLLAHGISALIAVRRQDRVSLAAHLAAAPDAVGAGMARVDSRYLMLARALAAEQADDRSGALALLASSCESDDEGVAGPRNLWLPDLVRLALAEGDMKTARRAVDAAVHDARSELVGRRAAVARWCSGMYDRDVTALDACADYYRAVGWQSYLGNVYEQAAVAAAMTGDLEGSRARIKAAADVYTEIGAEWELSRGDARVRELGVRRGRRSAATRPATGWQALTKAELRVVELVAKGHSNPEIATMLFLSRRTVQTHVRHILAKLQLPSRVDVAREAVRHLPGLSSPVRLG